MKQQRWEPNDKKDYKTIRKNLCERKAMILIRKNKPILTVFVRGKIFIKACYFTF
jgi:hypothetical protein